MRTLVTGFGPFLGISDNPSARLARHFAAHGAPGHNLSVRVLPVSFAWAGLITSRLLEAGRYDAALLLGVDSRGEGRIRLERYGRNRTRGSAPDVDGRAPGEALIVPGAPDFYETRADPDALSDRLGEEGIPAYVSEDAGGYVCNAIYFSALHAIARTGRSTRCLFVHVPPASPAMPLERQRAAVEVALEYLRSGG